MMDYAQHSGSFERVSAEQELRHLLMHLCALLHCVSFRIPRRFALVFTDTIGLDAGAIVMEDLKQSFIDFFVG